jgi:hypothetical protein
MKARPPIGTRVRLNRSVGVPRVVGKTGTVVAHVKGDPISVVVRLDPQTPLRRFMSARVRRGDERFNVTFRRRENDWIVDYQDVRPGPKEDGRALRRRGAQR